MYETSEQMIIMMMALRRILSSAERSQTSDPGDGKYTSRSGERSVYICECVRIQPGKSVRLTE